MDGPRVGHMSTTTTDTGGPPPTGSGTGSGGSGSGSGHLIVGFTNRLHTVLDRLRDTPAWSMTPHEQRTALVELTRAEARIAELRLRVLVAADRSDIAADSGASSTAAWLAHHTSRAVSTVRADLRLAHQLDTSHTATRDALAAGALTTAQATVIIRSLSALPAGTDTSTRQLAENHLIDLAADHDEKALTILGRRVLDVIDPAAADHEDGRRLAAEETAAARATYLHLHDNGDGTHTGRFKLPTLHAAMLTKMLHTFLTPRHTRATRASHEPPRNSHRNGPGTGPGDRPRRRLC